MILWALALSATARADPPFAPARPGERVVYRGATIIDGTGGPAQPNMAVITNGPRIEDVLPASRLSPALTREARVVDLSGRYLLPGLIDSHQHMATPPNRRRAEALMRRDLYSGITATRIMADDLRSIAELDRAARAGAHGPLHRVRRLGLDGRADDLPALEGELDADGLVSQGRPPP